MGKPWFRARKIVSLGFFFLFVAIIGIWSFKRFVRISQLSLSAKAPVEKKFMSAWQDDLVHLEKAHVLPEGFKKLKSIQVISSSEKLKSAFNKYPLSLERKPDGRFNLEIFIDEIEDESGGVVVQYDLVDLKSGNTIWELGRTFPHNLKH